MTMTKEKLVQGKCQPCEGHEIPLRRADILDYLKDMSGWRVTEDDKILYREFSMKNFSAAVDFISNIAQLAENQGHHPDIHLTNYRRLKVELMTHAIKGLSENDFIMAAKIDELQREEKTK